MKKLLFVLLAFLCLTACTNKDGAKEFLEKQGYTDIEIGGHCYWGCSDDDNVSTAFEATNANGARVSGCVCEGYWGKNKTIRFD